MIKRFVAWLYAIYFTPVPAPAAAESQSSEVKTVSQITLSILTNSQPADGVSADVVQAIVTDANGAPVPGALVNFSAPAGTVSPAQGTTDTNGQASASLVSSTEGPATLVATLADGTTASVNTLYFVAVPAPAAPILAAVGSVGNSSSVTPVITVAEHESILAKLKAIIVADEHYAEEEFEKLVDLAKTLAAKL
ncbi:Ig-like domain-containing protein [Martelella alba]|uniref:Big-1 domain-containing protein n=1 Tax=Martelella alba TaxID=2590451 RepID=A0ABY2SF06_9HYPH|nr:Ig-like domain-containing protein [Martelella alba]TKI02728.1 hypothetical protein FCN80_24095 [Martelella alba]